jgi:hypothetical protein
LIFRARRAFNVTFETGLSFIIWRISFIADTALKYDKLAIHLTFTAAELIDARLAGKKRARLAFYTLLIISLLTRARSNRLHSPSNTLFTRKKVRTFVT